MFFDGQRLSPTIFKIEQVHSNESSMNPISILNFLSINFPSVVLSLQIREPLCFPRCVFLFHVCCFSDFRQEENYFVDDFKILRKLLSMTYRVSESFIEGKLVKEERVSDDMTFHQAVGVFVVSIVMSNQREELFKETSSTRS